MPHAGIQGAFALAHKCLEEDVYPYHLYVGLPTKSCLEVKRGSSAAWNENGGTIHACGPPELRHRLKAALRSCSRLLHAGAWPELATLSQSRSEAAAAAVWGRESVHQMRVRTA